MLCQSRDHESRNPLEIWRQYKRRRLAGALSLVFPAKQTVSQSLFQVAKSNSQDGQTSSCQNFLEMSP